MRRKSFILGLALSALTALSFAAGPYGMTIGSGAGSLTFTDVFSTGFINGDDGSFNPTGAGANDTIWNLGFMVINADNTAQFAYMDDPGFSGAAHTGNQATDGTIANSATQVTNNGIGFPAISGLTANLQLDLTAPAAGDTARMTWAWTFNNASANPINLRFIWFVDVDSYLGGSAFDDDLVGFAAAVDGVGLAAGVGENSGGNVDMNNGVFLECSKAPARVFGITSNTGSSFYWSAQQEFTTASPEIAKEIPAALHATIQGDVSGGSVALENTDLNFNGVTDAALANDCGVAFQVNLTVPNGGSDNVSFIATWGKNTTLTGLAAGQKDWSLY